MVRQAVSSARGLGMRVLCSFMFPHPWDTEQTVRQQKVFMKELVDRGATVTLALTTHLSGNGLLLIVPMNLGIRILTDRGMN